MRVATSLAELRAALDVLPEAKHKPRHEPGQATAARVALVPTMGALHAGHVALVHAARRAAEIVVVSVFVNPLQFEHSDDLARYPRDAAADLAVLADCGCDLAWMPTVGTMYPPQEATTLYVGGPALGWEGAARPGHFRGVATVVAKLFGQVRPDLAVFGEKDWQQLQVIRRMVTDLCMPVQIAGVATLREADGLAMSSRNRFLSARERSVAPFLFSALAELTDVMAHGMAPEPAMAASRAALFARGFEVEYLGLVDGQSMQEAILPDATTRVVAAARLGSVRLLDNIATQARRHEELRRGM